MKTGTLRNAISIALFVAATGTTTPVLAQEAARGTSAPARISTTGPQTTTDFNLPAGTLGAVLDAFGTQSGLQVNYPPELVAGKQAAPVHGHMSWRDALSELLEGTGLGYDVVGGGTVAIRARAGQERTAGSPSTAASGKTSAITNLDSVQVTGTRIRGGSTPSPVITIGSEQIAEEGFSDLGEVIRNIPQNFAGGQNPGIRAEANPSAGVNNQNVTGGSGMNLRGLGPDATLTLLNGRRLAYGGLFQMVDISTIPVEAVERIEIVPDGSSAIYGSDAVGGVANVILRRDFDGVTVGARYGGATDGGLITRDYTVTAGTTWSTGGLIATWKKSSNDPIYSSQRDYTQSMYRPSTLWSGNDLRSGLLSLHQSLGESMELHLDALKSERNMSADTAYPSVYHRSTPETKTTLLAPSLELQLFDDWSFTLSAALGEDETSQYQQVIDTTAGGISATNVGMYSNKSLTYEIGTEGRLFMLPGGDARLAAGAGYRYNSFLALSISSNRTNADGDGSSRFAYAELSLPLIGPEQHISGVERLMLTGAVRTEDGNYGTVTIPKLGLIYSPTADFTLKTSWGKSFKAPTFQQRYWIQNAYLYPSATFGSTDYPAGSTGLYRSGGSADLRPERARTWSASLAFHPESLPGLESELTWFNIDYTARIVQPMVATEAFSNPVYAEFVDYQPTAAMLAEAIGSSNYFTNFTGAPYDASKVVAIVDNRYVNASRQQIKGLDLSGRYRFDPGAGQLTVRGSVSWLDSTQATVSTQSPYDLSGTLFNPAKLNGRIGAIWSLEGFTASVFGNYKSGVKNTMDGTTGASFTTFDSTLRYDTGPGDGAFADVTFELVVQNLLNREPPLYEVTSLTYAPYDSTNYSAMGRFLSFSLSKHW